METSIRNIKEEDWIYFKVEAVKKGLSLGNFFSELLKEHKKIAKNPWKDILKGPRTLDNKTLDRIKAVHEKYRKDFKFR
ncbi:hypothetical protein KY333_01585, partial [Candidatus Woesearchaeota archaeon]|nr:hypothetical protein [Candidatus Woesearchaeota archaeon]